MRILQVHNRYRVRGGEDRVVDRTVALLRRRGHDVQVLGRDSRDIGPGLRSRVAAGLCGIYSPGIYRTACRMLANGRPDVVHVHSVYPLISPSVLVACRRAGVPVVMTCHNLRLACPAGGGYGPAGGCDRCTRTGEHLCVLRNCRHRLAQSFAYALRGFVARKMGWFRDCVTTFISPSRFVVDRLTRAGFEARRFAVVPHAVPIPEQAAEAQTGSYAAFAGRLTLQKGRVVLLEAAAGCPEVPVRVAGDWGDDRRLIAAAPSNVRLVGVLDQAALAEFYRRARFLVMPSICPESFGLVATEAMAFGLPVVASAVGALPELVEDGVTGLLVEPGNAAELSHKMRRLWQDAGLCAQLGRAARRKAVQDYAEDVHYDRLMGVYRTAVKLRRAAAGAKRC